MSEVKDYEMFTNAGNRLIHNRVETVRKNVIKASAMKGDSYIVEAKIKQAIAKGIKGYAQMTSEKHCECHDSEPRNHFLHAMEDIYMDAAGVDRTEAGDFISDIYYQF